MSITSYKSYTPKPHFGASSQNRETLPPETLGGAPVSTHPNGVTNADVKMALCKVIGLSVLLVSGAVGLGVGLPAGMKKGVFKPKSPSESPSISPIAPDFTPFNATVPFQILDRASGSKSQELFVCQLTKDGKIVYGGDYTVDNAGTISAANEKLERFGNPLKTVDQGVVRHLNGTPYGEQQGSEFFIYNNNGVKPANSSITVSTKMNDGIPYAEAKPTDPNKRFLALQSLVLGDHDPKNLTRDELATVADCLAESDKLLANQPNLLRTPFKRDIVATSRNNTWSGRSPSTRARASTRTTAGAIARHFKA